MKKGIVAGAIAGAVAGIIPLVSNYAYSITGIFEPKPLDVIFLASQVIIHPGISAVWGAIFGLVFGIVFDRIPGKGITKGLLIGLIYSLFSAIRPGIFFLAYGSNTLLGLAFISSATLEKFAYGILFVALYRRKEMI